LCFKRLNDWVKDSAMLANPDLQRIIVTHAHDLVAAVVGATRDAAAMAEERGVRVARLRAIRSDVAANLCDSTLTVAAVASRHRVTPRYVHKLFEAEGITFSEFVLGLRLARAQRMLTDPRLAGLAISAVAYEVGFGDLSHFNRAFRRVYGATPSEVRRTQV
jgi:AraC-like DNA-binding protein